MRVVWLAALVALLGGAPTATGLSAVPPGGGAAQPGAAAAGPPVPPSFTTVFPAAMDDLQTWFPDLQTRAATEGEVWAASYADDKESSLRSALFGSMAAATSSQPAPGAGVIINEASRGAPSAVARLRPGASSDVVVIDSLLCTIAKVRCTTSTTLSQLPTTSDILMRQLL